METRDFDDLCFIFQAEKVSLETKDNETGCWPAWLTHKHLSYDPCQIHKTFTEVAGNIWAPVKNLVAAALDQVTEQMPERLALRCLFNPEQK